MSRADGYPGLAKAYGLAFSDVREMDLALTYRALAGGEVDVIAGNATDGLIDALDFDSSTTIAAFSRPTKPRRSLRDAIARASSGARADRLSRLGGRVTSAEMRRMNRAVDADHAEPREVVRAFLDGLR